MSGDHLPSSDPAVGRKSATLPNGERRSTKVAKVDDVASSITGDLLMILHNNFHFPNDVVMMVLKRSDRASLPPPGYLTVSETSLRAGLRLPPPAELVEILKRCGVCLSQFSYRAMSVTVGLITLFRDRGTVLTPEHLSRMGRLTSGMQRRVTFRCKWLDMRTRDPAKSWSSSYFFLRNDWGLLEKWGKMRDLPAPLHIRKEDIMRLLKEAALTSFESSRVIEDFKKSIAFKIIIQDHIQEARDHIYEVEVKALEQQCLDDGFIRGFLKGVRLMQRKIGVEVEGLTPSQASDDFPPGSDGDEIESELHKAFALEADDEVVPDLSEVIDYAVQSMKEVRSYPLRTNFQATDIQASLFKEFKFQVKDIWPFRGSPSGNPPSFECDLPGMVLKSLLRQGFGHWVEKRQMPGVPDSGTDSEIGVKWSERLPGCDYYACWLLQ
ncbi:hypothetical protein IEQ34_011437 [Dendrobium chrysotoxum]|uniref:Uncharacterized protein n=1 Tax=Dendrobium chrysotoxum TaxID=161865 RepID=A0AAV7GSG6_DENCH|nr:hypothetical protein IEQ34_011437 [Dendrobium chrysotoxum]